MKLHRRTLLSAGGAAMLAACASRTSLVSAVSSATTRLDFPAGFLWGAASAGHQTEGNNVASDIWLLEHVPETVFADRSGDATNSFELWPADLDLVKSLGLNACRFSIEWARIEPAEGEFSLAMLDHYRNIIEGCRARNLAPLVTFNHFAAPAWFSARGGWLNPSAPALFARYCGVAARHLAAGISHAVTINEPNLLLLLRSIGLPQFVRDGISRMLDAATRQTGGERFSALNAMKWQDIDSAQINLLTGHRLARNAIKQARPDLPVGVSLAIIDEHAEGAEGPRDRIREELYGAWLEAAKEDDFIGVQNYERSRIGPDGRLPQPADAVVNFSGTEVYPASLAGAVRYAHRVSGRPVLITEHGVGTDDDAMRARFIEHSLVHLHAAIADGVPVLGYTHWTLLDNFEWIFGYAPKFGLVAVDRQRFTRTPKRSAAVLGQIARMNSVTTQVGAWPNQ
ncbi:MAG: glycoside hydrolase family 1 protein [Gammaproteobacteria bacterium]|nr:glycoside hydrolase family 1 protein [Gammaproteobacteria bacterium]